MGGQDGAAIGFGPILAKLEFTFDTRNGDSKTDDACQHGAAIAMGKAMPMFCVSRLVSLDQASEKSFLADAVFDELERTEGVDGDVVPSRNGELLGIERGADVAVRTGEDDKGLVASEICPMGVGLGEMAFEDAVRTVISDDEGKMRGSHFDFRPRAVGAEENGERVCAHRFDKDGAVSELVEFGRVHQTPLNGWMLGFVFNVNGPATMPQQQRSETPVLL